MKKHTISEALRILNERAAEAARSKYPNVPAYAVAPKKYRDSTANDLTKSIIAWLKLNGCQAERISPEGRVIDSRKNTVNCIGQNRTIGSIKRIKSSMTVGTADISAIIAGRAVKIEIKIGSDKQSPEQKAYQEKVEEAGGIYLIIKDFQQFFEWYQNRTH